MLAQNSITGQTCYANYAVFDAQRASVWPFMVYYLGWLMTGTILSSKWGNQMPDRRKALHGMSIGYLAFMLPTVIFNIIDPATVMGIPSIMCGFAVLLAFVIVLRVLPNSVEVRNSIQAVRQTLRLRI
ncbi:hypothetical protein H7X69_02430 [Candidatus Saccharibacteria bacterium]|nr:hypothetical protein [Candidatus Saccharibacteria bacterium]